MLDFTIWDHLLHQYVDREGQVNYHDWQQTGTAALNQWLSQMAQLDLRSYPDRDTQLALWLNLYNALVIDQVLARYPIDSIRPVIFQMPNWIVFLRFFQRSIYRLHHQPLSLNQIEHQILRRRFQEPRIHFALVCAARGCPLLRNEAYCPERVQQQLEADAQRFIQNPGKVRWDAAANILYCSQIFKWYGQDFLQAAESLPAYIQAYLPQPLPPQPRIRYLPYDWRLNSQ